MGTGDVCKGKGKGKARTNEGRDDGAGWRLTWEEMVESEDELVVALEEALDALDHVWRKRETGVIVERKVSVCCASVLCAKMGRRFSKYILCVHSTPDAATNLAC